ncbi:MAG: methyltransferase domain-containing protein [Pirellulales bacterium]
MKNHQQRTIDQFSKQAACFAESPEIKDEVALQLVIQFAGLTAEDDVLDVACGPGILACACAKIVQRVTGIDITPAMVERAKDLQARDRLENLTWHVGDVRSLPFPDNCFTVVMSRYTFHHLMDPFEVLVEMKRVCKPLGRIVVIDVAAPADPKQALALNEMERLRDPSHVCALSASELAKLFSRVGLADPEMTSYRLEFALDVVLAGSFPSNGDNDRETIRQLFKESLSGDSMGLKPRLEDDEIRYSYPIAVLKSTKES